MRNKILIGLVGLVGLSMLVLFILGKGYFAEPMIGGIPQAKVVAPAVLEKRAAAIEQAARAVCDWGFLMN